MEQIRIAKVSKSFGIHQIFTNISFDVLRGERVALVGPNGAGKSTLLKCIIGEEELDGGQIIISDGATIGYLQQDVSLGTESIREEINKSWKDVMALEAELHAITARMETAQATTLELKKLASVQERLEWKGGYDYEAQSKRIIFGLGFTEEDLDKPAGDFSGGQKTRINVAKALVRHPDFLLLDEPTNHLDMDMLEWLENYLSTYGGGILMVSHDRYFLDRVATSVVELNHEKVKVYKGNYSRYLLQKEAQEKADAKAFEKQQEHIRATEAYIDKYRAGIKSKMARGRQSQLDRLERLEGPEKDISLQFTFPKPAVCADKVLVMNDVYAGYGNEPVIRNLHLLLRKGDAVGLIGPNGAGKSTLVKAVMGELDHTEGQIDLGNRVQVGYFSQEHDELHPQWSVIEEIMNYSSLNEAQARNVLGRFLFRGDAVFRLVGELSGGEQARLSLLKIFLEGDNFLILDEPTNHLDIPTREIVEKALLEFGGTYLVISHDRYFLDKITRRTLYLDHGQVSEYLGNYSYYKEKLSEQEALATMNSTVGKSAVSSNPVNEIEKESNNEELAIPKQAEVKNKSKDNDYMHAKKLEQLETEIARLEATVKMYELQLSSAISPEQLADYEATAKEFEKTNEKLKIAYAEWEHIME